jgi:midasin (ATPase involved in ribosome maturation)
MLDGLNTFINSVLSGVSSKEILDRVLPEIEQKIKDTYGFLPTVHEIIMPERTYKFTEPLHEKFDEVTAIVSQDIPVYLTGKAGTGKNVICKQVAKALGLDFYFTNAVTQEYKLTGFIDANGTYQGTQFYQAFTKGGLFFLDEMDASIPETLVILNAAIANRYFDFPIGKVDAHPDFRVVAAGNTVGTGADSEYTGRYCLDEASLDRFAMVEISYSRQIEDALSNGDNDLVNFAHTFRDITEKAGLKCLFSYRTITRVAKLKSMLPLKEVLKISLLKGLDVDDINILKSELKSRGMDSNPYGLAILNY